jgi:hypothetical protein
MQRPHGAGHAAGAKPAQCASNARGMALTSAVDCEDMAAGCLWPACAPLCSALYAARCAAARRSAGAASQRGTPAGRCQKGLPVPVTRCGVCLITVSE